MTDLLDGLEIDSDARLTAIPLPHALVGAPVKCPARARARRTAEIAAGQTSAWDDASQLDLMSGAGESGVVEPLETD